MDIEMPRMNGIDAVRRIMAEMPTPILMFSSLTYEGAKATLEALDAGALDFLPKQLETIDQHNEAGKRHLQQRVMAIARRVPGREMPRVHVPPVAQPQEFRSVARPAGMVERFRLVLIGASTGGPVAVQNLLSQLPANFPAPIVVAVHMPANFTRAYAERLDSQCRIKVREASDGDRLQTGEALVAPGGQQLIFEQAGAGWQVRVKDGLPDQIYRPSIDLLFGSAARMHMNSCLAVVLTGMGADGQQGARLLKQSGARIWSQSEGSCVVFGMPNAVESAGLSDRVMTPEEMGLALAGGK
jgi:two-component system chemotaxis response regulator CheB